MFNFSNLNDVEFEYLCKDVMSKMLNVKLQRFGIGRDGGIDLTDDAYKKDIIIQVKHYIKTDVYGLINSLKKEVEKVKSNNPKQYYICCSKELTPQNKQDIYAMFSGYMASTDNIISIVEISDFLEQAENTDILHKHFKLWIESTNILTDIFTKDICIDSDILLSDINDSVGLFVKTSAYDDAISCLQKNNVLIIIGNPGVGKTMTSKMLVLSYASSGYRIRYTTDGTDLAALKKSLSQSPDVKEVILLDDCFGQAYFSMKETQENELLALIKYVKLNQNKLLIMNSRVTIYQEASERNSNLIKSFNRKEYKAFILDMNNISVIEKAKIFYNHLFFYEVPKEYRENIKKNKSYLKIVNHTNYNPRIMEFVVMAKQIDSIDPTKYSDFIIECLENPEQIWKNEYERRLANTDRILMTTLYSLTNTTVPIDVVKKCYEHRLIKMQNIDLSVNHFEQSLRRLQNSMVNIVDVSGIKMLSTSNPSVNDFLSVQLERNMPERNEIIENCICVRQLKRLLSTEDYEIKIKSILENKSILEFVFESNIQKIDFITYYCIKYKIFAEDYRTYFESFILHPHDLDICEDRKVPLCLTYKKLFNKDICLFYGINNILHDIFNLESIISQLVLDDIVVFIKQVDYIFENEERALYVEVIERAIKEEIECYCQDIPADEYDVSISDIVEEHCYEDEHGWNVDGDGVASAIDEIIKSLVLDEIAAYISEFPKDIIIEDSFINNLNISVNGSASLVESYLVDDYQDYYYDDYRESEWGQHEIEYIFER